MRIDRFKLAGILLSLATLCPAFAHANVRVVVAPVRGNAKYPLVMNGLREVLVTDLAQSGPITVVPDPGAEEQLSTATLEEGTRAVPGEAVVFLDFVEKTSDFLISVRVNDSATGYSAGTREIHGTYGDVKAVQDRLFATTVDLLRTTVTPSIRSELSKSHSRVLGAIQALGEAEVALKDKKYIDAIDGFSRARAADRDFKTPTYQLTNLAPSLIDKIRQPELLGQAYASMGDTRRAMEQYNEALKKDPRNTAALVGKGNLLLQTDKPAEALTMFKGATDVDSKDAMAAVGLARAYQKLGRANESLAAFERARDLGATRPEVYETLGAMYAGRKQPRAAVEAYRTAGELAERAVNFREAQRYYSRINTIAPSVISLEREAETYLASGEALIAINLFNRALMLEPGKAQLLARVGYAYYVLNQPTDAMRKLQRAYDLDSANYDANFYLGLLYSTDKQMIKAAIRHLENASRIRPEAREPAYFLANLYVTDNRASAAIAILEKLAQIHSRDSRLHKELADAYFAADNLPSAETAYSRAINLAPDYKEAHEGLARLYIKRGDQVKAFNEIDRVYAIDPTNNIFVREGGALLEALTPQKVIELALRFPKVVTGPDGDVPINQVGLVPLTRQKSTFDKIKSAFELYEVNYKRLRMDLEVALYSQYRVLTGRRLGQLASAKVYRDDFESDSYIKTVGSLLKLDGLFGFEVRKYETSPTADVIVLDVVLRTLADRGMHGIEDKSTLPEIYYQKGEILRFNTRALMAYALTILLLFGPLIYFGVYRAHVRGWGKVRVIINYDPKLESFLTLKLSTRQEKVKDTTKLFVRDKDKYKKKKYRELLKQKGAWVRQMVGKVTAFDRVPARSYYCYLYGTIEDTVARSTVGNYYMVQKVQVDKDQTREIVFQLEKEEAFITVFVRKGEEDVAGAEIQVEGDPDVKFSRGDQGAFLYLPKGKHKITVKHEDRSVVHEIEVWDLNDKTIQIDLLSVEETETAEIAGRPLTEAAEDFESQGRLEDAAKLYDKAGATDRAGTARAQSMLEQGDLEGAVQELVKSRDFMKAAEIYTQLGDTKKASMMFGLSAYNEGNLEQSVRYLTEAEAYGTLSRVYAKLGDEKNALLATARDCLQKGQKIEAAQAFAKAGASTDAAEIYVDLKDPQKAALLYAKDGNYEQAAEFFAQGGDTRRAAAAFEKAGKLENAVSLYKELGETKKILELMIRAENYLDAAKLYRQEGSIDDAITLCQKVPSVHSDFPHTQLLLAQMFMEKGMNDLALKTFNEAMINRPNSFDTDALYNYGGLLEKCEDFIKALEIFEILLKQDFHFKDVSLRVNDLREKAKAQKEKATIALTSETVSGAAAKQEGRYEILEELGRGAMGVVSKARDKMLDRIVAFKTLPHTLKNDPEALQSLMKEAQTAAKLNHPNIVTVFDVGEERGDYFIAMEYVEGKTLQDVLKQVPKVTLQNFMHIAKPLCEAVGYAHEQRIIHRDIKPSNIILLPSRTVKLMDFGLAKILQDIAIDKTMLRGTPLYMSPEQVLGKDIDHRTDIYSLGVLFYEMLAGAPPFVKGDIMYAHLHTPPPPLANLAKGVPNHVLDVIMKALSKDKTERPATASELLQGLSGHA